MTAAGSSTAVEEPSSTPSPELSSEEKIANAREKIASDLKNWQDKFAQAADKGAEDLEERVKEITDRQISDRANGVGKALTIQLEEASTTQIAKLKSNILELVRSLSDDAEEARITKAEDEIAQAVKNAGLIIKEKAQALRSWKLEYVKETGSLVSAASKSTLAVLDNISNLGLQEIGMRWAWMEGVTYKDWSKYHEVKSNFDQWTTEVESVAKQHPGIEQAQQAGDDIESQGMLTAEETATELRRLKDVGVWKLRASDDSDDFSSRATPPKAAKAAQKIVDSVKSVGDQASGASSQIVGSEPGMAEKVTSKFSEASVAARKSVVGSQKPEAEEKLSSVKDRASKEAEKATVRQGSLKAKASKSSSSASSAASDAVSDSSVSVKDKLSSVALLDLLPQALPRRRCFLGLWRRKSVSKSPFWTTL